MADKVKPLKMENSALGGTENDLFPTEVDPTEDYLAAKGLALENNDNRTIDLSGAGHIQFKDAIETIAVTVRQLRTALNNLFDNSTNGFTATNVQAAIEEARNNPKARVSLTTTFNGTIGNNQWLGYNNLIPGDQVPIRIPWNCKVTELSFSYAVSSLLGIPIASDQIDGVFSLYKNGLTAGDIVYTNTFTNQVGGKLITGLNISLNAGDYIVGRWTDTGDNPSDMALCYFFLLT